MDLTKYKKWAVVLSGALIGLLGLIFILSSGDGWEEVEEVSFSQRAQQAEALSSFGLEQNKEAVEKAGENNIVINKVRVAEKLSAKKKKESALGLADEHGGSISNEQDEEVSWCDFNATFNIGTEVIISEVAWMGSVSDSSEEWMELRNAGEGAVNLKNWQIQDRAGQIKVNLPEKELGVGAFFLISRAERLREIGAEIIYLGALGNSNEEVRVFNPSCEIVDRVVADSKWPAGDNKEKRSMERGPDLSWHTFSGEVRTAGVLGTPGFENSLPLIEEIQSIDVILSEAKDLGEDSSPTAQNNEIKVEVVEDVVEEVKKILINCVATTGGAGKTKQDLVEIYNPNEEEVNLRGYRLVKRSKSGSSDSGIKSWTEDDFIEPGGVYVWANSVYTEVNADVSTTAVISDNNGVGLRFGPANTGELIDSVAWGGAENEFVEGVVFDVNPNAGERLCRKNFADTNDNSVDFLILD